MAVLFQRTLFEITITLLLAIQFSNGDAIEPDENHHRNHVTNDNFVILRDSGKRFLINFYSDGCVKCEQFMEDFDRIEVEIKKSGIEMFDCNSRMVMQGLGIQKVPSLMYFRNRVPTYFDADPDAEDIIEWIVESHESTSQELNDDTFEHMTQASSGATTGDWLVIFCIKVHADCNILTASVEHVGLKLQNKVNAAWVDINHSPGLIERFGLKQSTEVLFFRKGKKYDYHLPDKDMSNLLAFASGAYQHSRGEEVAPPKTPFDEVTEKIAHAIKEMPAPISVEKEKQVLQQNEENLEVEVDTSAQNPIFLVAALFFVLVLILVYLLLFKRGTGNKQLKKGV